MTIALVVAVATVGVLLTIAAAYRMWHANRRGAPIELVLGYAVLMVLAAVGCTLVLRAI